MFIYEGVKCPYCGKPLAENDDIAVCPDCGTPHHRECYLEHGECANSSQHSDTFEWKLPEAKAEAPKVNVIYICSKCGARISKDDTVCPNCGEPLPNRLPEIDPDALRELQDELSGRPQVPDSIYGIRMTDRIDGVTLKDLSNYLKNPGYVIAICKQAASGSKFIFSLPALFSPPLFFLYNKVWLEGLLALLLSFVLAIPDGMIILYRMTSSTVFNIPLSTWDSLSSVCSIISLLVNLFFAFFGMNILKKNAIKKIKKLRSISSSEQEFSFLLQKYSPPSKMVMVVIGLYIALLLFSMFYM